MTESRNELFERGWRPGASVTGSLESFLNDLDVVYIMQCPKCENPPKVGGMRLETWHKEGHEDKAFVVCRRCWYRRAF